VSSNTTRVQFCGAFPFFLLHEESEKVNPSSKFKPKEKCKEGQKAKSFTTPKQC